MTFYKGKPIWRMAGRFIFPIYIKKNGNFNFSSTLTFVKLKLDYYAIFAFHALNAAGADFSSVFILRSDLKFVPLSEFTKNHKIFCDYDLVVCQLNHPIEGRYLFDLDNKIDKVQGFNWIGFPAKKAKIIYHKTRIVEGRIQNQISKVDGDVDMMKNANYLNIGVQLIEKINHQLIGQFSLSNAKYDVEGFKDKGYSPRGMSGGALFCVNEAMFNDGLNERSYFFFGIGLEYCDNTNIMKGISRDFIFSIINDFV